MELVEDAKEIYSLEAFNGGSQPIYKATFSPKFVEREYLDKFPGWSRVDVTTGWLNATVNGVAIADVRIATDPERFWDYYQSKVLTRIYDHVMRLTNNRPTADAQPFPGHQLQEDPLVSRSREPPVREGHGQDALVALCALVPECVAPLRERAGQQPAPERA